VEVVPWDSVNRCIFQNNVLSVFTVVRTTPPFTILQRANRTHRHHSLDRAHVRRTFALYKYRPQCCMPDTGQVTFMDLRHLIVSVHDVQHLWHRVHSTLQCGTQDYGDKCTCDALGPKCFNNYTHIALWSWETTEETSRMLRNMKVHCSCPALNESSPQFPILLISYSFKYYLQIYV
jgi:hypothetical protein